MCRRYVSTAILSISILVVCLATIPDAYAQVQSWTIGNDQVKRVVTFSDNRGLFTEQLSDLVTHTDFVTPGDLVLTRAPEFSFTVNGHAYRGASDQFALLGAEKVRLPHGESLTVRLQCLSLPMQVSVFYQVYDGQPAIRKHLVLTNTGTARLRFSHLNIEALAPSFGPSSEVTLLSQYGSLPRETFYTGRSEDAGLFVTNARTGIGFTILSEVPGFMKRTEVDAWSDPTHVLIRVLYDTDLMPFERSLAPSEQFTSASESLVLFRRGDGFRDPHWVLPSYTAKVLLREISSEGSPWIYNTWEPFERNINERTALSLIDAASEIGIDIFTVDDGWQQEYGENAISSSAFPNGLEPLLKKLQSKKMRLGLWLPLAAIGTSTSDYRHHPEWVAMDSEGKPKVTSTAGGAKAVMCLATPFRKAAADRINQLIEKYHLAYVKIDLTTVFNAYGEAPGCSAKDHFHSTWGESLNQIYEGIAYVTQRLHEEHPHVLVDLTFELWGQKHVIDAGLLAAGDLDWLSNVPDASRQSAGPLQARTLLYQRASSIPVDTMLIGNMHADTPDIRERFATALGSAPLLLGDLRKLSETERTWYGEHVRWFKKLRKQWPIDESFFPLGSWLQPATPHWDGFARLAHSGNGVIVLFRNSAPAESARVELPLMPQGRFRLHSVITGRDLGVSSKSEWVSGVEIPLSPGPVEVLEVTALDQQPSRMPAEVRLPN